MGFSITWNRDWTKSTDFDRPSTVMESGDRGSGSHAVIKWVLVLIALACLALSAWFALRSWRVHVLGSSYGCGSPFRGQYLKSNQDAAATESYACYLGSSHRRLIAIVSASLGLAVLFATIVWISISGRSEIRKLSAQSQSDSSGYFGG